MSDWETRRDIDPYKFKEGEFMSNEDMQEARTHLGRAGRQGRHAAKNVSQAAQNGASAGVDEAKDAARRLNVRGLSGITGDAGTGFLALSVALYAGAIAYNKFGSAIKGRGRAVSP